MSKLAKHFKLDPTESMKENSARLQTLEFNVRNALERGTPIDVELVKKDLIDLLHLETKDLNIETDKMGLFSSGREMTELLENSPYLALVKVKIYIPRGMKGTFKQSATELLKAANVIKNLEEYVLSPLITYTAGLIEKPEGLQRPFPLKQAIDIKDIGECLSNAFEHGSERTQAEYGKVIERNRDWKELVQLNNEIQSVLSNERLKSLVEKHNRIKALAKMLDKNLEAANADLQGSAKTIQAFIEQTQYSANLLSAYGILNAHALSFNTALHDNLERLESISS